MKIPPEIIVLMRQEMGEDTFQPGDIVVYKMTGTSIKVEGRVWLKTGAGYIVESFNTAILHIPVWSSKKPPSHLIKYKDMINNLPDNDSYFVCSEKSLSLVEPAI